MKRSAGRVREIYLSGATSATYASVSTSPSPKCSWLSTRQSVRRAPSTRRLDFWSAFCERQRTEEDGECSRDPGAAGACPPGAGRHHCCAGLTATRADLG